MIVDSSAIIAIVNDESGASPCLQALVNASSRKISAATLLEAAIVADRHANPLVTATFDRLIERFAFTIEPVTAEHVHIAREAYRLFGKGRGHPAGLNFGDCFAYALAKDFDEPLLFIGNDFVHTDIRPALG